MSNKTRSTLRMVALIIVALAVLMQLSIVVIPALYVYNFWLVVIAFVLILNNYSLSIYITCIGSGAILIFR